MVLLLDKQLSLSFPALISIALISLLGQVDFSLLVRYGSSLGETPHYYSPPEFTVP